MLQTPGVLGVVVPSSGLLFGLMLVAAIVGGHAARFVRIPRVVGFLLGGAVLQAVLSALLDGAEPEGGGQTLEEAAAQLKPIKDLALGLILFTIGAMFERSKLKAIIGRVMKIGVLEMGLGFLCVFIVCAGVSLLTRRGTPPADNLVLSLLLAVAAVATAPAATLFVLREYEAKGPVTDTILGLTAVNNLVCIVLFQLTFLLLAAAGAINTSGEIAEHLWLALLWSTVGSVVIGVAAGTLISLLHGKLPLPETLLFFFAVFIMLGAGEGWLWRHQGVSYNFLLVALVMGGIFSNIAIDSTKLETALRTVGSPIFAGFFVMAGYDLHPADLASMGWLGGGYVVARCLGKFWGCKLGVRWAGAPDRADDRLGPAMLCQAAVVIGLASFVERNLEGELASLFSTVVLGSVIVFELTGPLLVQRCVVQAGEVKAFTLLRRAGALTEGASILRLTLHALARMVGWRVGEQRAGPEVLLVKHIMRTNVQFIPASATFDEVLHAIERSTYSHFPVVHNDGQFAGVIHFSDIHDVIYDPTLSGLVTAVDLIDTDSAAVPVDLPLPALLDLFNQQDVGVLPVVGSPDDNRIVGLVEQRDLLRALHRPRGPV